MRRAAASANAAIAKKVGTLKDFHPILRTCIFACSPGQPTPSQGHAHSRSRIGFISYAPPRTNMLNAARLDLAHRGRGPTASQHVIAVVLVILLLHLVI